MLDEHPLGAGVCASCHVPSYRDPTLEYDPRQAKGVAAEGVHCDYCHKIADVSADETGLRFGRDGLHFLRSADDRQLFFGPLDDAVRPGEAFSHAPLYRQSRYCAACHEGVIFGVHVYGTYSEWLESPARRKGQQCQTCHMAPGGTMTNIAPGRGGIERDPHSLASHAMPAAEELLRKNLHAEVRTTRDAGGLAVVVELIASNVGHRVPTGFIDRHLILVVQAFNGMNRPVMQLAGPRVPASGSSFADLPGWIYAKQLISSEGRSPLPFWRPHEKVIDTRLYPERPDHRSFRFTAAAERVQVRVVYRRFWQETSEEKSWPMDEAVIVDKAWQLE